MLDSFIGTQIGIAVSGAKKPVSDLDVDEAETLFNSTQYCFQTILDVLGGKHMTLKYNEKEKYIKSNETEIDGVMTLLLYSSTKRSLSAKVSF